jgi:hypothetical protein
VQLLIDRGRAMEVYTADIEWMVQQTRKVVGSSSLQVLYFAGNPVRGAGPGGRPRWRPYTDHHLPPPGTVVAVITELGISGETDAAPASEWISIAERLQGRECPLIAFVPYGPNHWPHALVERITLVHWDWTTNSATVHATAGKGLETSR